MTTPDIPGHENPCNDPLPKSYKARFAFTLACPSFIYPDHILPNVCMLAPFVDQIEVLVFESEPVQNLPPEQHVAQMAHMLQTGQITFNVHLPVDVDITHEDQDQSRKAVERIAAAVDRVRPLCPTTWTLHLPCTKKTAGNGFISQWQRRAEAGLKALLEKTRLSPGSVSVENLGYPPEWMAPVIRDLDLSVCLDIGHLIEHGYGIGENFKRFKDRITVMHLYGGVKAGRGHLGLHRLAPEHAPFVAEVLEQFCGIVSVEVFSRKDLVQSLESLENLVCHGDLANITI